MRTAKRGERLNRIGLGWGATRKQASKLVWFCRACTTAPLFRRDSPIYALRLCRHYTLSKPCARTFTTIRHHHCNSFISQVPTDSKFTKKSVTKNESAGNSFIQFVQVCFFLPFSRNLNSFPPTNHRCNSSLEDKKRNTYSKRKYHL